MNTKLTMNIHIDQKPLLNLILNSNDSLFLLAELLDEYDKNTSVADVTSNEPSTVYHEDIEYRPLFI